MSTFETKEIVEKVILLGVDVGDLSWKRQDRRGKRKNREA